MSKQQLLSNIATLQQQLQTTQKSLSIHKSRLRESIHQHRGLCLLALAAVVVWGIKKGRTRQMARTAFHLIKKGLISLL